CLALQFGRGADPSDVVTEARERTGFVYAGFLRGGDVVERLLFRGELAECLGMLRGLRGRLLVADRADDLVADLLERRSAARHPLAHTKENQRITDRCHRTGLPRGRRECALRELGLPGEPDDLLVLAERRR